MEPIHDRLRNLTWYARGIFWVVLIFSIEFITGLLIKAAVGRIPWDYSGFTRYSIRGLIRLDYAPVWFVVGMLFEQVHDFLRNKIIVRK